MASGIISGAAAEGRVPRQGLVASGFLLAVVGNVGWALIIGTLGVAWPFWAIAAGTLLAGIQRLRLQDRRWMQPTGWVVAAVGAAWLLVDQVPHGLGSDFPAEYLYYVGFLVAALTLFRSRTARLLPWGLALSAAGGLWWTALDVVHASFSYTWANAALGVGYALVAAASGSRQG
jgi:hypothetical protein